MTGEKIRYRDGWIWFLADGEQTGGAYGMIQVAYEPNTAVPLHVHEREDETFLVLAGQFTFQVGHEVFVANPGDYVFGPRNVPHAFANKTAEEVRAVIFVSPAGFEEFFRESAQLVGDEAALEALMRKYGVKFVADAAEKPAA